ncbi:hypothetical protein K474DRAFT_1646223 [Panus rudis PR-1116 ss-1]|nr:hypothetical protein K474DRAFT_1646223 [Panus rudis PR-1116 ss-1]
MPGNLSDNAVGPVPARTFLGNLMQPSAKLPRLKRVTKNMFLSLITSRSEALMNAELARIVNISKICPTFNLRADAQRCDKHSGLELRPHLALFCEHAIGGPVPPWSQMEFFAYTDSDESHDPFRPVFSSGNHVLRGTQGDSWKDAHERLTTYLASQLSRQHRTFTFALSFFGRLLRFLRIDRAGVIVSSVVNYIENPRILAEFFWRYSHMSPTERGFDPCVVPASDADRRDLTRAVFQYVRHVDAGQARRLPNILRTLSKDYPAYKVSVMTGSSGVQTNYIIRRSFTDTRSLFGRGTRGFVALKLDENGTDTASDDLSKNLVFLKDSWRLNEENMEVEGAIYEDLRGHGVPHLPTVLAAGDVYSGYAQDDPPQQTISKEWATMCQRWNRRDVHLHTYVHHRLVQKLAYPLDTVSNARELIHVMRDALTCTIEAYKKARRLHRDISSSNVMLSVDDTSDACGILNDWDTSCRLSESMSADDSLRVGTWRFMSINLLQYPQKPHEFHDDLESIFWVLLFIALCHFKHTNGFSDNLFDDCIEDSENGAIGGASKFTSLLLGSGNFLCPALDSLIQDLSRMWGDFYALRRSRHEDGQYQKIHDDLARDPEQLLKPFDKARAMPPEKWINGEWIPRHYPHFGDYRHSSPLGTITDGSPHSQSTSHSLPHRQLRARVDDVHESPTIVARGLQRDVEDSESASIHSQGIK